MFVTCIFWPACNVVRSTFERPGIIFTVCNLFATVRVNVASVSFLSGLTAYCSLFTFDRDWEQYWKYLRTSHSALLYLFDCLGALSRSHANYYFQFSIYQYSELVLSSEWSTACRIQAWPHENLTNRKLGISENF